MKKKIILIGGGGHCKSCIDVIEGENKFEIAGIIDGKEKLQLKVLGYEVIGCDEDLPRIVEKYKNFLITIGQIKNVNIRIDKFELLKKLEAYLPIIISPSAYVSKNSFIAAFKPLLSEVNSPNAVSTLRKVLYSCAVCCNEVCWRRSSCSKSSSLSLSILATLTPPPSKVPSDNEEYSGVSDILWR